MLNIYKASAGSGKTFTLTGEYIKTLFESSHLDSYRHVLAVTFTNKATDEMKQRIMEELYNLTLPDKKSPYLEDLVKIEKHNSKDNKVGSEELISRVRIKAKRLLIDILHDYSAFRVSTIDQFFQVVMRAFAREMGKMSTYNVELETDSVLLYAIDKMFADLDDVSNSTLLERLKNFAIESANEGNPWNIKNPMIALGGVLFNDSFRELLSEGSDLPSAADVDRLKKFLQDKKIDFEKKLAKIGKQALDLFNKYGVEITSMKGGSRTYFNKFKNWSKGEVVDCSLKFIELLDNFDNWYSGKKPAPGITELYDNGLNDCVRQVVDVYRSEYNEYNSALLVLPYLNTIAVLGEIYKRVQEYCKEKNIMLLSESTLMLNKIIDGSDTPFVYEKIGTSVDNYMLDEFQDTSLLQWKNFYPLLNDSLSRKKSNLIVGDVKQSIYRWRGSDWEILNSKLFREFRSDMIFGHSLDYNWRSTKNIVNFNNIFFKECATLTQQAFESKIPSDDSSLDCFRNGEIKKIYSNFEQKLSPSAKDGMVEVDVLESASMEEYKKMACDLMVQRIKELLEKNILQKDIAVLVRSRNEAYMVSEVLIGEGYGVISVDSLCIGSSPVVQKIVNILRDISKPNDPKKAVYDIFYEKGVLDADVVEQIKKFSLYNMCEEIIRRVLSENEKKDITYIQAFLDSVLEYTSKNGTNIKQFISWWDTNGCNKNILSPEGINAITVMTIHKSKGLGFNVVFVPFFNLEIPSRHSPIWTKMKGVDFYSGPVSIPFKKGLIDSVFAYDYLKEYMYEYIDNLNIGYVALTRAKMGLYVFCKRYNDSDTKGNYKAPVLDSPGDILCNLFMDCKNAAENGNKHYFNNLEFFDTYSYFRIGNINNLLPDKSPISDTDNITLPDVLSKELNINRLKTTLRTGNISDEPGVREKGIAMHNVFSKINTILDVHDACKLACDMDMIKFTPKELEDMVMQKLKSVEQYKWFLHGIEVLNERSIITQNGDTLRPDRVIIINENEIKKVVIIDYKFGEYDAESPILGHYQKQVAQYSELFKKMGYEFVEGYLWFVIADRVVKVV